MLLYTMTEDEIVNEINKDIQWVLCGINLHTERATRRVNKFNRKKFPISLRYKFITPNANTLYVTYVYTTTRTIFNIKLKFDFLMNNSKGKYKMLEVTLTPYNTIETISVFSGHFFDRYVERLNLKNSVNAIEHFISHYYRGTYHVKDGKVFEPYPFGVGLGNLNGHKFIYINTFIATDMFYKEQSELTKIIQQNHIPSFSMVTIL